MIAVKIEADVNDGDYVTEETKIAVSDVERFIDIANVVMLERNHNWGTKDQIQNGNPKVLYKDLLSEADIEWFEEFVPDEEYGIHTIESIEIRRVEKLYRRSRWVR